MDGWMDGWVDGWEEVKAILMIAYSNQKREYAIKNGLCCKDWFTQFI